MVINENPWKKERKVAGTGEKFLWSSRYKSREKG